MFARAYAEATRFTRPIITLIQTEDGKVHVGIGSYIVINADGWILTAAHILAVFQKAQQDAQERQRFQRDKSAIESNPALSPKVKRRMVRELDWKGDWIKRVSVQFPPGNAQIAGAAHIDGVADIATGRLNTLSGLAITGYATFPRVGDQITPGTSLCTFGFPFQSMTGQFNESLNRFEVQAASPPAFFPSEGIHTRNVMLIEPGSNRQVPYIETSSPGLKGQSGGPIVDVNGVVRALQSRTIAFSLDIAPVVREGGREVKEHQFIQVGIGCHVDGITDFLTRYGVPFSRVP